MGKRKIQQANISKEEKKMRATAKRIVKRRKENETLDDELVDFRQINSLLRCAETGPSVPTLVHRTEPTECIQIPSAAPGYSLLDPSEAGCLFTEKGILLARFVPDQENLFGRPVSDYTPKLFRKLLLANIYELRNDNVSAGVSMYVLHLLASSTHPYVVTACAEFLKRFPCAVTSKDVLPMLQNLGICHTEHLFGEEFQLEIPDYLVSTGKGRDELPSINIAKLGDYLSFCVEEGLLPCDETAEKLVSALSKLALDWHIRGSPLLAVITKLLSRLATRCSIAIGCNPVAGWLLYGHDHQLNQLEVCRLTVCADAPLYLALLRRTFRKVLNVQLKLLGSVHLRDVRAVVRACKHQPARVLPIFVAIQLLISALPGLTVTAKEVDSISKELSGLESQFGAVRETSDSMRFRAACAQLRGLLMMAAGSQLGGC